MLKYRKNSTGKDHSMKTLLLLAVLAISLTFASFAQDQGSPSDGSSPYRSKVKVGGAGGFTPEWGLFNFDGINSALKTAGMPLLKDQPMYLAGGEGYGYIMFLKNVRMGGCGVTGTVSSTTYDPAANIKKNVDYNVSYGGFLIDYVLPLGGQVDVAAGVTIGGGGVDVTMSADNGTYKQWNTLWSQFGQNDSTINITRHLNGSFFTLQPHVSVEYAMLRWFQLRVGVSYPYMTGAAWKLEDSQDILNVPSNLKTEGPVVTAGIMFGFFN